MLHAIAAGSLPVLSAECLLPIAQYGQGDFDFITPGSKRWLRPPAEIPRQRMTRTEALERLSPIHRYEVEVFEQIAKNWSEPSDIDNVLLLVSINRDGKLRKASFIPLAGKENVDVDGIRSLNKAVYESKFAPVPEGVSGELVSLKIEPDKLRKMMRRGEPMDDRTNEAKPLETFPPNNDDPYTRPDDGSVDKEFPLIDRQCK
jgi:hypothetical protein